MTPKPFPFSWCLQWAFYRLVFYLLLLSSFTGVRLGPILSLLPRLVLSVLRPQEPPQPALKSCSCPSFAGTLLFPQIIHRHQRGISGGTPISECSQNWALSPLFLYGTGSRLTRRVRIIAGSLQLATGGLPWPFFAPLSEGGWFIFLPLSGIRWSSFTVWKVVQRQQQLLFWE